METSPRPRRQGIAPLAIRRRNAAGGAEPPESAAGVHSFATGGKYSPTGSPHVRPLHRTGGAQPVYGRAEDASGWQPGGPGGAAEAELAPPRGARRGEVGGFVGSILTVVAFCLYLTWAYVPDSVLRSFAITYYPSKYWAIAVPAYALMAVAFALVFYTALCYMHTARPDSLSLVFDDRARSPPPDYDTRAPRVAAGAHEGEGLPIPPIFDLPLPHVNDTLYGPDSRYARFLASKPIVL